MIMSGIFGLKINHWRIFQDTRIGVQKGPQSTAAFTLVPNFRLCECLVAKLCLTLCDPMDSSPPGSSVHGVLQARILEWNAIFSSRDSPQPWDRTHVSCIGRQILYR